MRKSGSELVKYSKFYISDDVIKFGDGIRSSDFVEPVISCFVAP